MALSLVLPVLWVAALWLAGAYDVRFVGTGSDEFRKALSAGVSLTAALAIFSYAINLELSRGYVVIALPAVTLLNLVAAVRAAQALAPAVSPGAPACGRVVAVGTRDGIRPGGRAPAGMLSRSDLVAACVLRPGDCAERWASRSTAVSTTSRPRSTPSTRTPLRSWPARRWAAPGCATWPGSWRRPAPTCGSPRRCSTSPVPAPPSGRSPGLPLLHLDHPELAGPRRLIKARFDRPAAAAALVILAPVMSVLATSVWLSDRGPALFTQVRVGETASRSRIYKFRTMVVDAEQRQRGADGLAMTATACCSRCARTPGSRRSARSCAGGPSTSCRSSSTSSSATCRWSGRGPAPPDEATEYAEHVAAGWRQAGTDRPVAGQRSIRPILGRVGPARPAVRRELVVRARPADLVEDDLGAGPGVWGLLVTLSASDLRSAVSRMP